MKPILCFIFSCMFIQSVATNDTVDLVTNHDVLDNLLRLERAVTNMTWELDLVKTDLQRTKTELQNSMISTKSELKSLEVKLESATARLSNMEGHGNVSSAQNSGSCPHGFICFQDSCYWFSRINANYAEARSYCGAMNSHLVVITNREEDDFVRSMATRLTGRHFLGATDLKSEGRWVWEGGMDMVYTNWGTDQPNNYQHGSETEQCLDLYPGLGYRWNDARCSLRQKFICEKSK